MKERDKIKAKYGGKCAYCGNTLPDKWHVDHFKPVVRDFVLVKDKGFVQNGKMLNPENDNFDNKVPSCPSCNILKSSGTIEEFRRLVSNFTTSLNRDSTQYKAAKRYGLIKEIDKKVTFYFENYEPLQNE